MYLKTHASPDGEIVALCDIELIGKVLESGKARLDLSAYAPFYLGKKVEEKEAVEALKRAKGVSNEAYHYLGAAKIMAPIGKAFAEAMGSLQKTQGKEKQ